MAGERTVINVIGDDETLAKSDLLTREEVLRRRLRRVKNLSKIYRDMYWTYMEELKVKHREYYWEYGKSPFQEEDESSKGENGEATFQDNGDQGNRCGVHGCKSKAMALTKFCQMHILSDSQQKLYKPCNFAIKSSQTGPILCGKPILRSTVPSYCALHFQKAEKDVAKALKKAGLSVSATTKLAPKFHVVVSELVRQIQTKRKEARKREIARTINDVEEDISC